MSTDFLIEMAKTHASPSGVLYDLNGDGMAVGILIHGDARTIKTLESQNRASNGSEYPVSVSMPCGESTSFEDHDHFPATNYPCPCGKPEHFMVYWVSPDTQPVVRETGLDPNVPEEAVLPGHRISTPRLDTTARTRGGRGKVQ